MKNKHKVLVGAALLISFATKAQSSKKMYANLNFGYSLPLISQPHGTSDEINSNSNGTVTNNSQTNFSRLGSGVGAGLAVGYTINSFLSIEVGANYINTTTHQVTVLKSSNNSVLRTHNEMDISSSVVNLMPGLRFSNQSKKNEMFFRMAPIFGITTISLDIVERNLGTTQRITEETIQLNGGLSYGMFLSGGYTRFITDNLGITVELFSNLQHYTPRKGKLTKATLNGVDRLADLKKSEKEIEFTNEATYSSDSTPNDNWPTKYTKDKQLSYLLSGVGIQIGLHYKF